jgi:RHS repeat-associated protein
VAALGAPRSGGIWAPPDRNTTGDETGKTFVYDAWNRLVAVKSGATVLETFSYDGLNRRVTNTASGTTTDLYYSDQWQVLEEKVGSSTTNRYVWSPVYVDTMVLRDRDTDANGTLDERLWVQQDANWNVTALVDGSGAVVEGYAYDPFGSVRIYSPTYSLRSSSSYSMTYAFQGMWQDSVSGLDGDRERWYSPTLGRWTNLDPIRFDGGDDNFYSFVSNAPTCHTDPSGLKQGRPFTTQEWEDRLGITTAINNGGMSAILSMNGKSFVAKGGLGKADCSVTFKFERAFAGRRYVPEWRAFGGGMYIKMSITVDHKNCCSCDEVNVVQIAMAYRKDQAGRNVVIPSKDWAIDTTNRNPYYIDPGSGQLGVNGGPAILYDAPAAQEAVGNPHVNYGRTFWSCVVCRNKGQPDVVLASISWGYYIDANGNIGIEDPTVISGTPPQLGGAVQNWNNTPGVQPLK